MEILPWTLLENFAEGDTRSCWNLDFTCMVFRVLNFKLNFIEWVHCQIDGTQMTKHILLYILNDGLIIKVPLMMTSVYGDAFHIGVFFMFNKMKTKARWGFVISNSLLKQG